MIFTIIRILFTIKPTYTKVFIEKSFFVDPTVPRTYNVHNNFSSEQDHFNTEHFQYGVGYVPLEHRLEHDTVGYVPLEYRLEHDTLGYNPLEYGLENDTVPHPNKQGTNCQVVLASLKYILVFYW